MPPLSLSLTRPSHPPPTRWSESRELLQHLDEALNANDPAMLTDAIKRGLRQVSKREGEGELGVRCIVRVKSG